MEVVLLVTLELSIAAEEGKGMVSNVSWSNLGAVMAILEVWGVRMSGDINDGLGGGNGIAGRVDLMLVASAGRYALSGSALALGGHMPVSSKDFCIVISLNARARALA
jgi:hypothetical protein